MFSDPKKNVSLMQIPPGSKVCDIGAGSGFYTIEVAKHLANTGKVFSVDIQKDILSKIQNDAKSLNLSNTEVLWGDVESDDGLNLAENTMDYCILSNTLFQIKNKKKALSEIKRILVPNGKLILIDWADSFSGIGPQKEYVVKKEDALLLFEKEGFVKERDFDAGSHHYGIIFHKL